MDQYIPNAKTLKRMESSYGYYAPRRSSGHSGGVLRSAAGNEYIVASCDTHDNLSASTLSKNQLPDEHGDESATVTTANTCSTANLDYMMCDDSTVGIIAAVSDDEEDDASKREWARSRQRSLVLNIVDLPGLEDAVTFPSDSTLNTFASDREEAEQLQRSHTLLSPSSAANYDIITKECDNAMDMVDEFLKTGTWSDGLSQQPQGQESSVPRKKVHFSNVTIREYALCIGEVSDYYPIDGPPLSLDWAHSDERTISVKEHERRFHKRSSLRRLDSLNRKFLLTVVGGFTEEDFRMQLEKSKKSNKFRKLTCFFRKKISKLSKR